MGSFVIRLVFGKAHRTMRISGTTKICAVAGLVAFAAMAAGIPAAGQSTQIGDVLAPPNTPPPARPSASGDQIFAELVRHNEVRSAELREYSAVRTYSVTDLNGKVHAKEIVQMQYVAPDKKTFVTTMEEGSGVVRHLVLNRLMESETSAAAGQEHHDSSITPTNYSFQVLGEEELGGHHCFVVKAIPKRKDKYLFEGRVWIDSSEFAVVKIAGRPAKKLSFWITQADFVRQYEKIGNFWLPARDETFVDVRLYGKKILSIDHHINSVNGELNTTVTGQDRRVVESAAPRSQ